VSIIVPPYYEEHTSVLMEAIKSNPLVLAKLLNRELPQELMQIAEQSGIKIFPSSWQDIKLNCSCPDWAVPCKHLAAVIYIIANEIDKNPFLVFKLHNFDILEQLKEVEKNMKTEEKQPVLNLSTTALNKKNLPESQIPEEAYDLIDFSTIPELTKQIISLYPPKTLFFNGDFQTLLASHYKTKIKRFEKAPLEADTSAFQTIRNSRISVCLPQPGTPAIRYQYAHEEEKTISLTELCTLLRETSPKHLFNYSPHFSALYYIFHYCRRLVKQGALLPQLMETGEHGYRIRWVPALINKEVKAVFEVLEQITPSGFCRLEIMGKRGKVAEKYLPGDENLKTLCALFLDFFFKSEEAPKVPHESAVSHNSKVAELFFCTGTQHFSAFTEKEIPNAIQLWLNRFNIARKDYAPVLAVDEFVDFFKCSVLVESKDRPLEAPVSLQEFLSDTSHLPQQMELIKDLAMLAEYMPELNGIITSSGRTWIRFDNVTVVEMLEKTLPALELFGIRILLPKSLQAILKPQVSMKIIKKADIKSYFSLDELLAFDWRVALGDFLMTEEEFRELSKNAGKLVRIKDRYALMTEDEIKKIIRSLSSSRDISSLKLLQSVLSEEYEGAMIEVDEALRNEIRRLLREEEIALPQNLQASLRPYQQRGFNWMYKNARLGFGSVLADDMGLGKTLQVITTLLKFKEEGRLEGHPALVVAPTTLLTNWDKEIRKFAPGLNASIYHGTGRKLKPEFILGSDVVLTSYGIARSETEKFKKIEWYAVIVDEAQNIKNSETAQAKSIRQLKGKVKIAMSGTPVENRLSEYWSIFDFSNTGYLGSLPFFNEHFAKPIELNKDRKKLENFRKITQPFILRREKSDKSIINDLPDKIENNQYCTLTPEQTSLYNETVETNLALLGSCDGPERLGLVVKLLGTLKQICNHPSQYLKKNDYSPSLSGKAEMLFQLLDNIYESGEKVLIFSQYAQMGSILLEMIYDRYGKKSLFLHGGCSRKERDDMVNDFQRRPDVDTLILSLKAGGTGLNLTAASHVIHYDLWWNPAVEAQATDRAFRIGQQKNVMVYRFITKNTLEEKIDAMIQDKKELANLAVSKGESWIGNLNDKDLKELITLRV
jgi:SNF2 family DNA or RNA helicase